MVDSDTDRAELVRSAAPPGAHIQCAPSFFPGPWDAVVVPAKVYFASPGLRTRKDASDVLVYGPAHLFRAAWMAGARDYLREPWSPDEFFLRVRGPGPGSIEWETAGLSFHLEGRRLSRGADFLVLSAVEAALLRVLVQRRGVAVSRPILAWTAGCAPGRVVDTLIGRIRKKLSRLGLDGTAPVSVRGLGYRLP